MLFADLTALLLARSLLVWLLVTREAPGLLQEFQRAGPLAPPGRPASLVFWFALVGALIATGTYGRHRHTNTALRLASATVLAAAGAAVPLAAVIGWQRALAVYSMVAPLVAVSWMSVRILAEAVLTRVWPPDRGAAAAILMGGPHSPSSRLARIVSGAGGEYRIAAHYETALATHLDARTMARDIGALIDRENAEAVVLAQPLPDAQFEALIDTTLANGCRLLCPPRAFQTGSLRPRLVWFQEEPLLEFGTPALRATALLTKRITDVVGAIILLTVASPLILVVAIGVKLDSSGPVFFAQERAGLGGRRFRMLKFRTMRQGADAEKAELAHLNHSGDARLFKIRADPRVTRFGGFLRRWSLDELPQIWNVLRGEMSLVGPRPFFESDFADYEDHHFRRLDTKPGITGVWQVGGRSDVVNFDDVVYLDRQYLEEWSFWLDISILLRTIPSVFRRTGAY